MKLYSFRFSPPARLAQIAASICDVNLELIEVDLSKLEQFEPWYLAINHKHRVPVLEENGVYMDESLNIVRHFFNTYNTNPENDHWYPQDPDKRRDVDEWLEWAGNGKGNWKTAIHLTIRTAVVMAHMAPQQGMNWRDYMGAIICLIGYKARKNQEALEDLKRQLSTAEIILAKRKISCVEDLNIGDLSAFMEISVPMECLEGFHWADYPNLNKLNQLCNEVPGFERVHQPFLDFCREYRHHRDANTKPSWSTAVVQVFTSVLTLLKIARVESGWLLELVGAKKRIH